MSKSPAEMATKHEAKGDEYAAKGKHEKALKEYRKALDLNPESAEIFDKLIKTRDQMPGEWDLNDFAESMDWTMKQQERDHPTIRQVHAKLSPGWSKAVTLAINILHELDEKKRDAMIEELVSQGEVATRAMIGLLLDLKNAPQQESEVLEPEAEIETPE